MRCLLELGQVCNCQLPFWVSVDPEKTGKGCEGWLRWTRIPALGRKERPAKRRTFPYPAHPRDHPPTHPPLHPLRHWLPHHTKHPLNNQLIYSFLPLNNTTDHPSNGTGNGVHDPQTRTTVRPADASTPLRPRALPQKARRVTLATSHASSGQDIATLNAFRSST